MKKRFYQEVIDGYYVRWAFGSKPKWVIRELGHYFGAGIYIGNIKEFQTSFLQVGFNPRHIVLRGGRLLMEDGQEKQVPTDGGGIAFHLQDESQIVWDVINQKVVRITPDGKVETDVQIVDLSQKIKTLKNAKNWEPYTEGLFAISSLFSFADNPRRLLIGAVSGFIGFYSTAGVPISINGRKQQIDTKNKLVILANSKELGMLTPLTDPINRRINIKLNVWNSKRYSEEVPLYLVVEYGSQTPTIEIFEAEYIAKKLKNVFGETPETVKMVKVGGGLYVLMGDTFDVFDFDKMGYFAVYKSIQSNQPIVKLPTKVPITKYQPILSDDGQTLFFYHDDGHVLAFDLRTGQLVGEWTVNDMNYAYLYKVKPIGGGKYVGLFQTGLDPNKALEYVLNPDGSVERNFDVVQTYNIVEKQPQYFPNWIKELLINSTNTRSITIAKDDLHEFVNDQRRIVFDNKTKQIFKDHSVYMTNPTILVKTSSNVEELKEMPAVMLPNRIEVSPIDICS